jgi:hypothetical protein
MRDIRIRGEQRFNPIRADIAPHWGDEDIVEPAAHHEITVFIYFADIPPSAKDHAPGARGGSRP